MKALYLLLFASGAAFANDAALVKCRSLTDAASRLACYDAIPVGAAVAVSAPVAAVAVSAAPAAAQDFGLEAKKAEGPKSVESTIVGKFDGWTPSSRIKLANGQVWRIIDGSEAVLAPMDNPKVKIERNAFGTTFLQVEGSNNSAKVKRVE
jgi:hypothetical protein